MIGPMVIFGSSFSDFGSYPQGMIPRYDWSYEGMIGPMAISGSFLSDFRPDHTLIIPSGYDSRV